MRPARRTARPRLATTGMVAIRTVAVVAAFLLGPGTATATAPPVSEPADGEIAAVAEALAAILDDDTDPRAEDGVFDDCPLGDADEFIAIVDDVHGIRRDLRNEGDDFSFAYEGSDDAGDAVTCVRSLQPGEESGVPYGEVAVWAGFRAGDDYDAELERGYVSIVIDPPTEFGDGVAYTYCWYATAEFTLCGADWVPDDSEVVIGVWVGGFRADAAALLDALEPIIDVVIAELVDRA